MAIWCNCSISAFISCLDILSVSKSLIGCLCIAPLAPIVMVIRGFTCQPAILSACMSGTLWTHVCDGQMDLIATLVLGLVED